jgi:pimeloyl-ACP methyl ester carboxylesterase
MAQARLPNGVTLEYELHGDPSNPVIFVVLGITDNITDWPPGLYEPLVRAGYCVVRHELRDSGRSTKFESAGRPDLAKAKEALARGKLPEAPYTIHDVADDARLLLEHLGIRAACMVGYSFGSMVSQLLALKAPDVVVGLVCLQGSNYNPALPQRLPAVERAMFEATLDYPTEEERIRAIMNLRFATNGSQHALDAAEARQSAETSVARMYYPQGATRIILSRFATAPFFEEIGEIACPTLVLQADEDPIFNLAHGEDMTGRIPNAKLAVLRGAGHNHPLSLQPIIAEQLIKFTKNFVDWS